MGLIPQGLLCACLKIRASGKQLENEVLRAQITPCQSPLHKPHLHRADTESLQWHQGKPLICVLWEHCLCLSSQGALAQIFLPSCSLSLQETSKTPQHLQPQPYMGHLLTSLQSSRDSLALRCGQNPQKYAKPGSVEEILWRVCLTPSFPRDAACHGPGLRVLHPLYCSFGVSSEGWGEGNGADTCLKTGTEDILLMGTFLLTGKTRPFCQEKL